MENWGITWRCVVDRTMPNIKTVCKSSSSTNPNNSFLAHSSSSPRTTNFEIFSFTLFSLLKLLLYPSFFLHFLSLFLLPTLSSFYNKFTQYDQIIVFIIHNLIITSLILCFNICVVNVLYIMNILVMLMDSQTYL